MTPTVEQAADRAAVARTTAFRYFSNQRALLVATYPDMEAASLLGQSPPSDPTARLEIVIEAILRSVLEYEPELRTQLRLSLEPRPPGPEAMPFRQGRAVGWLEEALGPLRDRLPGPELRRLVLAIRATVGIEALAWLTDVGGLSRQEAADLMRSSARTLLRAAIAGAAPDGAGVDNPLHS